MADKRYSLIYLEEMKLIAPNPFSIEVTVLFAKMLRTLISTGNVE